jgi:MOSC domain-containing protein YiiM
MSQILLCKQNFVNCFIFVILTMQFSCISQCGLTYSIIETGEISTGELPLTIMYTAEITFLRFGKLR